MIVDEQRSRWFFNYSVDETSTWKAVVTRAVPPSCSLLDMEGGAIARMDPVDQDLLGHAVKVGVWLNVPQLKQIFQARKWPYPGPSKNRKKAHFVDDLINRLHPSASDEAKAAMRSALLGTRFLKPKHDQDACEEELLKVVSALDPENASAAVGVRKACLRRLLERDNKAGPDDEDAAEGDGADDGADPHEKGREPQTEKERGGWQRQNFTPPELSTLLPPTEAVVWIKRQPAVPQYCGYYERTLMCLKTASLFLIEVVRG